MKIVFRNLWAAWAGAGVVVFYDIGIRDLQFWTFFLPLIFLVKISEFSFYKEGFETGTKN